MQTGALHSASTRRAESESPFPPLEQETRTAVPTAQAAYYLNRAQQTMRGWACYGNGPIHPIRVHGRLAWKVADLRRVLEVQ